MHIVKKINQSVIKRQGSLLQGGMHTLPLFLSSKTHNPNLVINILRYGDGLNCAVRVVHCEKSLETDLVTSHGLPTG